MDPSKKWSPVCGAGEKVTQTMYIHVSKCKNNKIKGKEMVF
jgi:hypothetical protein